MKKIILQLSVSLDGYVEGPNREIDWHRVDAEFNAYAVELLKGSDVLIMGRKTYALMAGYWPTATDNDPDVTALMNRTPKLVFSRTLSQVAWQNSRLATGSIAEEVARLKRVPSDGYLCVGGSSLAAAFLDLGLLDELRIVLTPVLIGGGLTLLDGITRRHPLRLLSTRQFASGSLVLIYEPGWSAGDGNAATTPRPAQPCRAGEGCSVKSEQMLVFRSPARRGDGRGGRGLHRRRRGCLFGRRARHALVAVTGHDRERQHEQRAAGHPPQGKL